VWIRSRAETARVRLNPKGLSGFDWGIQCQASPESGVHDLLEGEFAFPDPRLEFPGDV